MRGQIYCYSLCTCLWAVLLWVSFPRVKTGLYFCTSAAAARDCWGRGVARAEAVLVLLSPAGVVVSKELPSLAGKAWPAKSPESRCCYTSKITAFWYLYCFGQDLMMQLFICPCSWRQGGTTPESPPALAKLSTFSKVFPLLYLLLLKLHLYHTC